VRRLGCASVLAAMIEMVARMALQEELNVRFFDMMKIALAALGFAVTPTFALADPPTHSFQIYSAATHKTDCAKQGGCANACVVKASLTLLRRVAPQAIEIDFNYQNAAAVGGDANSSVLSFQFPNFERSKVRTLVSRVEGIDCKALLLSPKALSCPGAQNSCTGSVNVAIKARISPTVKAQLLSN